ncbi:sensor histidine kinase [Clostridium sp. C105KSO13]|uniref:sensor histidine kinase n=1 Tax=Clostridium sp. C105KSO13 TaxID=1776045 RepID=UPI000740656C|nr:HAMP domain-containing sensor histidine kinase [Clostridium sp. C105KSO13]CUX37462.1 Sensor protein DivL [Clostridium sp. C105KSO13]
MKNWYKKPVTKGVLLFLAHITAVAAVVSMVLLTFFSSNVMLGDFVHVFDKPYDESTSFLGMMQSAADSVRQEISAEENFTTEGKYNPDKLVDIIDFEKNGIITGENRSGLAYTLGDLKSWSDDYAEDGGGYEEGNVVVCQKPDGTYHYYYMSEFRALIEDKKLLLEVEHKNTSDFLNELQEGYYTSGYSGGNLIIKNPEGATEYTDCWTFNEALKEKYDPAGARNILEIVNKTPELNGKLSKVYRYLEDILRSFSSQADDYIYADDMWKEGNTNFSYMFVDENSKRVYTNNEQYKNYGEFKKNLEEMKQGKSTKYVIARPKLADFETNMDTSAGDWKSVVEPRPNTRGRGNNYIFAATVDTDFPIQDIFYTDKQEYDTFAPYLRLALFGSAFLVLLFFVILIWLTLNAGRTSKDEELHLNGFDRWKTELGAALVIAVWIVPVMIVGGLLGNVFTGGSSYAVDQYYTMPYTGSYAESSLNAGDLAGAAIIAAYTAACFLWGYLSLVRRIKAKIIWKNSLLRNILLFLREFWENRSITAKAIGTLAAVILADCLLLAISDGAVMVLLLLVVEGGAAVYIIVKNTIAKFRLTKGIEEIASGNVDYKIPLNGMRGGNLKTAEMINHIGNGLQRAVEENMKGERLKTDLITNVSHDIKTPLTSIINYVDLLKRENFTDPKIQGYLDILEAKAQRLKTLTEDVVEASKVSSGNISLDMMDVNLVEMINQTGGEFAEKFEKKNLAIIQNLTEDSAVIHVDGNRMWRVLENIYNNTAKYAMPGTRVYADLWADDRKVTFSLKNVSEQPLNITADELTERFIRGDISRSTEGSGLGLSIAKSLTEMQGGEFKLYLDGDLFKVTIEFPRIK